jgi:hypothetical protein
MSVSRKTMSVSFLGGCFLSDFTTENQEKGTMLIWACLKGEYVGDRVSGGGGKEKEQIRDELLRQLIEEKRPSLKSQ